MNKEFEVKRFKNGHGHSHVPYAEGFKDPIKVMLQTNEQGIPITANSKFAIVTKYIYD